MSLTQNQSRIWRTTSLIFRVLSVLGTLAFSGRALAEDPKTVSGLKNPESVAIGPGGKIYVTMIGEDGKTGDGSVVIVDPSGKITKFAAGLDDPKGMVVVNDVFYVADIKKVWKINSKGKVEVYVDDKAFPRPPVFLNDIAADGRGGFYVSDSGDRAGKLGAVFKIDDKKNVTMILDGELSEPQIQVPNGVLVDDDDHLFVADFGLGNLYRVDLNTRNAQRVGGGFGGTDGIVKTALGALYISDWKNGRIYQVVSDQQPPILISDKFKAAADIALTADGKMLLVPDMKAGTLTWLPIP